MKEPHRRTPNSKALRVRDSKAIEIQVFIANVNLQQLSTVYLQKTLLFLQVDIVGRSSRFRSGEPPNHFRASRCAEIAGGAELQTVRGPLVAVQAV